MNNASIKSTARVDIFNTVDNNTSEVLTGTVGEFLTGAGLPPADYYSVDFHDDMGEARVDTIHNEDTDELLWDGNDESEWTNSDDVVIETIESYLYAAYSDWA